MMKEIVVLEGLNCPHCAEKINERVNKIPYIEGAELNFINKEISYSLSNNNDSEKAIEEICSIVNRIEPNVKVKRKTGKKSKTNILKLEGLNCPHCAEKINERIKKIAYLDDAELNFINKEISYNLKNDNDNKKAIDEIRNIVNKIEPDVNVTEISKHNEGNEQISDEESIAKKDLFRFGFGIILFAAGIYFSKQGLNIGAALCIAAYIAFGYDVVIKAIKNISRGDLFDENFLMGIASIGAICIGEYTEAVAVMLFYQIGEFLQDIAVSKSRKSIKGLMDIKSEYANLVKENEIIKIPSEDVEIGDIILIRAGEKIPVDGEVTDGSSSVDMSALIGEAEPRDVFKGEKVLSGSVNLNGVLRVRAESVYEDSTVAKIFEMVENAVVRKSKTENFITKFAKVYTPIVVFSAIAIAIVPTLVLKDASFIQWVKRALVFLVSSCPCALVVSVPLSFFSGIGEASKKGILIKGSNFVQSLSEINTVVFDKTGTITKGVFDVKKVISDDEEKTIKLAFSLEKYSNHPVGQAIKKYFADNEYEDCIEVEKLEEIGGYGLTGYYKGVKILAGNDRLMEKENIKFEKTDESGTAVYVAKGDKYIGCIVCSDVIKEGSADAVSELKKQGISKTVMLTGDRNEIAHEVCCSVGIDECLSQLLPNEKVGALERIYADNKNTKAAFIGDGINDAPVLARADVGIAMGTVGSDAAIEAADVVIMDDFLGKLPLGISIARKTIMLVKQNVAFIIGVKLLVLVLAAFGYASMWLAVFADMGVCLISILNSMRKKSK